jgi:hypothetical protein
MAAERANFTVMGSIAPENDAGIVAEQETANRGHKTNGNKIRQIDFGRSRLNRGIG